MSRCQKEISCALSTSSEGAEGTEGREGVQGTPLHFQMDEDKVCTL